MNTKEIMSTLTKVMVKRRIDEKDTPLLKQALTLVKKQEARSPYTSLSNSTIICPSCGRALGVSGGRTPIPNYCGKCGQRLDRSGIGNK